MIIFIKKNVMIHFYINWSRYSVADRRWTQMLTSSVEESSVPLPRYHHASALVYNHDPFSGSQAATRSLMFVVGGVTKKGVANDTWCLNLSSLVWKQYKVLHFEYTHSAPRLLFGCVKCVNWLWLLCLELSAAPCGWTHSNRAKRLICAADWRLLAREWL